MKKISLVSEWRVKHAVIQQKKPLQAGVSNGNVYL